ncbi:MAG: Na/Pi cotransporter family protein [Lachnospiraceae bacterium]|nr:Na/Pi cotransporter family protein [Candidatus Colinaster equi]
MYIFNLISLLGGLAMFLYGMRLMGDSLKEGSSGTLKVVMEKVTNNPIKAFFLGLAVTAIIQSSTATIVITSGLVAAGIISLDQSIGIIVGANVGTTVTGQIIRLLDIKADSGASNILRIFQPSTLAPIALIVGIILIMGFKFKKSDNIGNIAIGFGILFSGLLNMTEAVSSFSESGIIDTLFAHLGNNPLLGYLTGAGVAFVLQSSSATIGILQAFSLGGQIPFKAIYIVLTGIYLGDCVTTAIVCSIGAKADAKRVGIVNIMFNLSETVIVLIAVNVLKAMGVLDSLWNMSMTSGTIANTNTIFNLGCAILLLPLVGFFGKFSRRMVKDEEAGSGKYADIVEALNPIFFPTPALAFRGCYNALRAMLDAAIVNINKALDVVECYDEEIVRQIAEEEENIDMLADRVDNYLVQLSPHISEDLHIRIFDQYHKMVTEFEHLGDYADNIAKTMTAMHEENVEFSENALEEIKVVRDLQDTILDYTKLTFVKRDVDAARHIEPLEEVMDDMINTLHDNHLKRLRDGKCTIRGGISFLDILTNLERMSDSCSNVGVATIARVNPTTANLAHNYITSLHQGNDEEFNEAYGKAHVAYFKMLEQIKEDECSKDKTKKEKADKKAKGDKKSVEKSKDKSKNKDKSKKKKE